MSYKKRARSGWCDGKGYKDQANRSERTYAKEEINREMKEFESGEGFLYKHLSRKKLTKEQKLDKNIAWYEKVIEEYDRPNMADRANDSWFSRTLRSWKRHLKKLKEKRDESRS